MTISTTNLVHKAARNEWQVGFIALFFLSGIGQLYYGVVPPTLAATTGPLFQTIWAWSLVIASAVILIGTLIPDDEWGMMLELSGQLTLAGLLFSYATAIILSPAQIAGSLTVPILFLIGAIMLRRSYRIVRELWPTRKKREQKLAEEVERQLVEQAKERSQMVTEEAKTGEMPEIEITEDGKGE